MNKPVAEYNEDDYRAELIQAGLSPETAKEVAAKMAENRRIVSSPSANESMAQSAAPSIEKPVAKKIVTRPRATTSKAAASNSKETAVYDYQAGQLPERVRNLIEAHLAIEAEDAKTSGTLGFMTRSLAIATLPHRNVKDFRFVRKNGDFTLTMMTAHPQGLPYGTLPRLLLTWVCTEVAQRRERELSLGHNLSAYLAELGLHNTGGKRGDICLLYTSPSPRD